MKPVTAFMTGRKTGKTLSPFAAQQSGAVLIIGLLMLLVLTIIGVTGMSTTSLEERMARNDRDRQIAFQAAEAALRDGENFVATTTLVAGNFTAACTNGLCTPAAAAGEIDRWFDTTLNVWTTAGKHRAYSFPSGNAEVNSSPLYIVEYLGEQLIPPTCITDVPPTCSIMYRITARGTGSTDQSVVMLQSVFKKGP